MLDFKKFIELKDMVKSKISVEMSENEFVGDNNSMDI